MLYRYVYFLYAWFTLILATLYKMSMHIMQVGREKKTLHKYYHTQAAVNAITGLILVII